MTREQLAQVLYEQNEVYDFCKSAKDSIVEWSEADERHKDIIRQGVKVILADPELTPQIMHKMWLNEKAGEGWGHGPNLDNDKKQHPHFMEFDMLPVDVRAKAILFYEMVVSLKPFLEENQQPAIAPPLSSLPPAPPPPVQDEKKSGGSVLSGPGGQNQNNEGEGLITSPPSINAAENNKQPEPIL